ncbi:GNAT family N-acetyltransferase [Streptomyces millisiae]|uniref:GNAT family N-acetyltransferase n=1 Tax=Streptomyces millisiae TaxID=3075542 RepID=A0ABU2M200_9ACTN|nr:GNAT family N-acetyltransferase [Streptomyces sp. DSM 44918]MDT0323568.1 GNAT family N-acetyltransferase [Streptomyces sp. DSM 44918]
MRIRAGTRHDTEPVAALHADSWRTAYAGIMPDTFLEGALLDDRLTVWRGRFAADPSATGLFVAEDDGELVGFAYLMPRPDGRVLLDNLHARPGRTRSGIGGRLLRHSLAWAAATHPGRPLYLEVLRDNTPAVAFYERQGGRRTAERVCRFEQGFELPGFEYTWHPTGGDLRRTSSPSDARGRGPE